MHLVFRPSKLHSSPSSLTTVARPCIEKSIGKIHPIDRDRSTRFSSARARALTSPTAFIFRYAAERMARKTQVERAFELDSSFLRLIAPSGYTFEWLHQVVRAVECKDRVESSFQSKILIYIYIYFSYLYDYKKYIRIYTLFFSKLYSSLSNLIIIIILITRTMHLRKLLIH